MDPTAFWYSDRKRMKEEWRVKKLERKIQGEWHNAFRHCDRIKRFLFKSH